MAAQPTVVIVVDDDSALLKGIARLLARAGIEVRTFASAEALLGSGNVRTATCLLLDIHLSGIFRDRAATPTCGIGIEVPCHLHDWGRG